MLSQHGLVFPAHQAISQLKFIDLDLIFFLKKERKKRSKKGGSDNCTKSNLSMLGHQIKAMSHILGVEMLGHVK